MKCRKGEKERSRTRESVERPPLPLFPSGPLNPLVTATQSQICYPECSHNEEATDGRE
jgi:hypothetical protein